MALSRENRFVELDFMRGLAIIGMIVFHVFFILNFYGNSGRDLYSGGWLVLARFVQFDFLILVGISMSISFHRNLIKGKSRFYAITRQWRRAFIVLLMAIIVSITTYFAIPDNFVRFGILHFIALSIFVLSPVADMIFVPILIVFLSLIVRFPGIEFFSAPAVDFFPVFPWLVLPTLGIFLGNVLYNRSGWFVHTSGKIFKNLTYVSFVSLMGRHSLFLYIVHVPVLLLIFWVAGWVMLFGH